jgi:WD40 repeat protein
VSKILASKALLRSLQIAERAVQQNAYHHKHLDYRDLPDGVTSPLLSQTLNDHTEHSNSMVNFGKLFQNSNADDKKSKSARSANGGKVNVKSGSTHKPSVYGESVLSSAEGEEKEGNLDEGDDKDRAKGRIHLLYSYKNDDLVRGRPVTSMCWNCVNLDLLTVGYGTLETVLDVSRLGVAVDEELQGGLVLFWSLRNPDFPEKILRTPHAVTCLDFSKQTPSLLAVGLISGDVLVYDMRRQRECEWGQPTESSMGVDGGHTDPVWQLSWVLKGSDSLETLISISTDGSVLEWNRKKGFALSTLMQLKKHGVGEGWITRKAAGLCFDFLPSDPSTYMAGTEDGNVHHCSIAYSEQYLSTYESASGGSCHEGPIQRIAFSPHWPEAFLTCSADWTLSLFHTKQRTPLFSMHVTDEDHGINDISWCPGNSTLFASVTDAAKLQIWDLSVSSIEPVINLDTSIVEEVPGDKDLNVNRNDVMMGASESRPGTASSSMPSHLEDRSTDIKEKAKDSAVMRLLKHLSMPSSSKSLTCVKFGERSPTVVVGDNLGVVSVYRLLHPIAITHEGPLQQTEKLKRAVFKSNPEAGKALEAMGNIQVLLGDVPGLPPPSNMGDASAVDTLIQ